jgi:hypothetical protein
MATHFNLNPYRILQDAIRAVPALKYGLAVLALVAIVALASLLRVDPLNAVFGSIVIIVLMVAVLVFARVATLNTSTTRIPALIFLWAFVLLTVLMASCLVSAALFRWPSSLSILLFGKPTSWLQKQNQLEYLLTDPTPQQQPLILPHAEFEKIAATLKEIVFLEGLGQATFASKLKYEGVTLEVRQIAEALLKQVSSLKETISREYPTDFVLSRFPTFKAIVADMDTRKGILERVVNSNPSNLTVEERRQLADAYMPMTTRLRSIERDYVSYLQSVRDRETNGPIKSLPQNP